MTQSVRDFVVRMIRKIADDAKLDTWDRLVAAGIEWNGKRTDGRVDFDSLIDKLVDAKFASFVDKTDIEKMRAVGIDPEEYAIVPRHVDKYMEQVGEREDTFWAAYNAMVEVACPNPKWELEELENAFNPWTRPRKLLPWENKT